MRKLIVITLLLATAKVSVAQELEKMKRGISIKNGILTDSSSTLMLPVDVRELASSKTVDVNYFCANLIFYNFRDDSSSKLFDRSVCIMTYRTYPYNLSYKDSQNPNISKNWILYRVKNVDYDNNGKIDSGDPDILYSSDVHGRNLKKLTTEQEHVVSIDVYHAQNFALITLQHDVNQDGNYDKDDRVYSYVKLDLTTLTLGRRIESN